MTITVSIEEYIGARFDKFYDECKFQDVELSYKLKEFLDDLEADVIELAQQKYTSEAEAIHDEAWDNGFEEGEQFGYENGFIDGYDRAIGDHEIDA